MTQPLGNSLRIKDIIGTEKDVSPALMDAPVQSLTSAKLVYLDGLWLLIASPVTTLFPVSMVPLPTPTV